MINTKINAADLTGKGVVGLPDTPGLSTADMQAKFDELALDVLVPKHNALVDALAGANGAAGIGAGSGTVAGHLDSRGNPHGVTAAQVNAYTKNETDSQITQQINAVKAVYDTNNNGVVDDSEKLNGHPSSYFAPATHAAATAIYGAASATHYGHTRVLNSVTSTSATDAASAGAVKLAYDKAEEALAAAASGGGGGSAQAARQLLWSGTLQMYGTVTIPQVADYILFLVNFEGRIGFAFRHSDTKITLFGGTGNYGDYTSVGGEITITDTTLRVDVLKRIQHNASGTHNSAQDVAITSIWGIA